MKAEETLTEEIKLHPCFFFYGQDVLYDQKIRLIVILAHVSCSIEKFLMAYVMILYLCSTEIRNHAIVYQKFPLYFA